MRFLSLLPLWLLGACTAASTSADQSEACEDLLYMVAALQKQQSIRLRITALGETDAVAAGDPAIWLHPTDLARSLVLGTTKKEGLYVFDLKGHVLRYLEAGRVNQVDFSGASVFFRNFSLV